MTKTIEEQIKAIELQRDEDIRHRNGALKAIGKLEDWYKGLNDEILMKDVKIGKLKVEADAVWPKKGDKYWFVSDCGSILTRAWSDDRPCENRAAMGNVFRTEEEAGTRRVQLFARATILQKIDDRTGGDCPSLDGSGDPYWLDWQCNEFSCYTAELATEIATMPEFKIAIGMHES